MSLALETSSGRSLPLRSLPRRQDESAHETVIVLRQVKDLITWYGVDVSVLHLVHGRRIRSSGGSLSEREECWLARGGWADFLTIPLLHN